ncbi:hypothetical protein J1N35_019495 [Gossypium stocksii]|uniref:Uncharacterized protein n=1 Tax=Gossypium stocksii TaxID=47602 RepID=A0A9D3VTB9_9ROSI|nr:hypothetical protein J1N35_019495 [Gossypium stocksii]
MSQTREEKGNPMSFAFQASGRNSGGDKTAVCSDCNRKGHESGRGSEHKHNGDGRCDKGGVPRENVSQTFATVNGHRGVIDSDKKGLSALNDEQWNTFLGILSSHETISNERLIGKQ